MDVSAGVISDNDPDDISCLEGGELPSKPTYSSRANADASATADDPINTYTGELFNHYPPDIDLGGPMPLYFARYYASGLLNANIHGSMGNNWRHNFQWSLTRIGEDLYIISNEGRLIEFTRNGAAWDLTGKTDIVYQLAENAGGYSLLDPRDQLIYTFDDAGTLVEIADGKGNIHSLSYGSDLATVSDGLGRTLWFNYSNNKLSTVSDGLRTVEFAYTGNDLTGFTDTLGNVTTYAYDGDGLLTSPTRPLGNTPYTQTWNGSGQVASQADSDGNTTTLAYAGPDTTLTGPLGNTRVHTHTATGEFSNRQDQAGQSFSMGSDMTGRRNSLTDRLGDTTTIDYHAASGNVAAVTNADGTSRGYINSARPFGGVTLYDVTDITHEDGTTESFVYDAAGNLTSHTDQAGNTMTGTYNAHGQLLTATNTAGGVTTNVYNSYRTLASRTDPAGNTTAFGYDVLKRPDLITFADGATQQFTYNNNDQLLSSTNGNGNTTILTYDLNGNLETITDPLGNTATYTHDGNDRLLTATDPLGGLVSFTYDALGRTETSTDENGNTTVRGYDALGRLTTLTSPSGNSNSFTYDAEAVIASVTDGLGNTSTFTSDQMGRITAASSPLGNTSQLEYDAMGRIISSTDPLGQTTAYNRDSRGLLSGIELPGGAVSATYTRNSLGNITQVTGPNGSHWQSGFNNQGLRTSRTDPLGNVQTVEYDNRNRPATVTYADGVVQTLGYDPAGNLVSRSYSSGGPVFNYVYDANDRLISANNAPATPDNVTRSYDAVGRISNSNGIAISRDAGGRITGMTLAPGKSITYAYDANDNLVSVTDWAGAVTSFSYDAADRLTGITRPAANGIDAGYTYDNDSRLVGITEGAVSSISLTRDAKGQITAASRQVPQPASAAAFTGTSHSFDAASQIATAGFEHDARGRLTKDGTRTYTWDGASRLSSVDDGAATTYTYDALGRRVSRTAGGLTRDYVWNDALGLASVSIEQQGGSDFRYYIHTPGGRLLYSIDAATNARRFYHFDEMGNTIFVTNDAGSVIGSYAFTPFGQLLASNGSLDNPFTWQGAFGVMEEGSGLYYMRARYYDGSAGRFVSRDPIKSIGPKSVNPYQYALGNPLRFVDPSGMEPSPEEIALDIAWADLEVAKNRYWYFRAAREYEIHRETLGDPWPYWREREGWRLHLWFDTVDRAKLTPPDEGVIQYADRSVRDFIRNLNLTSLEEIGLLWALGDAVDNLNAAKKAHSKREAHLLHLEEIMWEAEEKYSNAWDALYGGGTRTRAQQDARRKQLDQAEDELERARYNFKRAGGVIIESVDPVESVVPELAPIVVPG